MVAMQRLSKFFGIPVDFLVSPSANEKTLLRHLSKNQEIFSDEKTDQLNNEIDSLKNDPKITEFDIQIAKVTSQLPTDRKAQVLVFLYSFREKILDGEDLSISHEPLGPKKRGVLVMSGQVVIYARYSSDKQNEQSIEGQLRICEEYCHANDYGVIEKYIDRATSGKTDNRIEFQRMIKDRAKKKFSYIVVYKLDRFSRDRYDSVIYKRLLKKNNIRVLSATEQITDSPEGIILESLLEGFAEYYSAELSQKVKRGNFENIQKGYSIGGPRLFGYKVIDKRYQIDEQEAKIARLVFAMYADGYTVVEIPNALKGQIIAQERLLSEKGLLKMLRNVKYTGRFYYLDQLYVNYYPRIIDDATFDDVQRKLANNKAHPTHKEATSGYLFSRKLFYKDFDNMMIGYSGTGKQGTTYYYYRLSDICKTTDIVKPIVKDDIEGMVFDATIKYVLNDEVLNPFIDLMYAMMERDFQDTKPIDVISTKLSKITTEIDNIVKAIKLGVSSTILNGELIALEKQKKSWNSNSKRNKQHVPCQ